ncbi:RNA polymerase sigma factor SigJ [Streptomyces sp. NPDC002012]|uniref:RNA polymerase sigma factor SigJ n=1 Tax=Streptomyces sp. NPDC002012 TaxID=3154532 RepID=UPI00332E8F31
MGTEPTGPRGDEAHTERRRLVGLAYRMLGTVGEAEDAVQESYLRWYRLSNVERAAVINPAGWLTRVTSRVCLDVLGSARVRREQYVGPWLPEPVPEGTFPGIAGSTLGPHAPGDPLDRVVVDESVSTALLVVLESMTPAERVALVLHNVFAMPYAEIAEVVGRSTDATRQLASSARRRVRAQRRRPVDEAAHTRVVTAFTLACRMGNLEALVASLDPAVTLRSDGGGVVRAALNPITGASKVARFLLGVLAKQPDVRPVPRLTEEGPGIALVRDGAVTGVVNLLVDGDRITHVWIQWNPAKLTRWPGLRTSHP